MILKIVLYQFINHYWKVLQKQRMLAALLDLWFKSLKFASELLCIDTYEQLKYEYQVMKNLTNENQETESRPTLSNSLLARMFQNNHTCIDEMANYLALLEIHPDNCPLL